MEERNQAIESKIKVSFDRNKELSFTTTNSITTDGASMALIKLDNSLVKFQEVSLDNSEEKSDNKIKA